MFIHPNIIIRELITHFPLTLHKLYDKDMYSTNYKGLTRMPFNTYAYLVAYQENVPPRTIVVLEFFTTHYSLIHALIRRDTPFHHDMRHYRTRAEYFLYKSLDPEYSIVFKPNIP